MTLLVIRLALLVLAGAALLALWRKVNRIDRRAGIVVGCGLILRAGMGQILFWISYFQLPFGRGLQLGDGLWVFALDARMYLDHAMAAADGGPMAVLSVSRDAPSVSYIQVLALFIMLFGRDVSVAALLNVFCYVLSSWILLVWGSRTALSRSAALVAITALTVSPAGILWTVQPLKDTFFQFLVVGFVAAAAAWQHVWRSALRPQVIAALVLVMCATLFAIAGVRWYFAFAAILAASIFFLLVVITAQRRIAALTVSVVALMLLMEAFVAGGGPYVPARIRSVMSPFTGVAHLASMPAVLLGYMDTARTNFELTGGATAIRPGRTVARAADETDGDSWGGAIASFAWVSGAAALLLPRIVNESLGLVRIEGGRGFLWFTDVDTVVFDVVLVIAALWIRRSFRWSLWANPTFLLVLLLTVSIAVPLAYTVTNFGTMFRLRGMVYVLLALVPLAVATGAAERADLREGRDVRTPDSARPVVRRQ